MSIHQFNAQSIDGTNISFANYAGRVLLIVNTASACGFTPQLTGLEILHRSYHTKGLTVIGFPCNQFGAQDPGTNAEIGAFCVNHYHITFTLMEKIEVNGANAHPLYQWLKLQAPGVLGSTGIKWNFTKFLVDRQGQVIKRYAPIDKPERIAADIEAALA